MKRSRGFVALAAWSLLPFGAAQYGAAAPAASADRYTITDLGTLGGPMSKAMKINDDGLAVDALQSGSHTHLFLWDKGTMTNPRNLGGQGSWAHDGNDAGQVADGSPLSGEIADLGDLTLVWPTHSAAHGPDGS